MSTEEKLACFTLDLEYDHQSEACEVLEDPGRWGTICNILQKENLPLTTFVVGRLLEEKSDLLLERYSKVESNEFELHSYSHDPFQADSRTEIDLGIRSFQKVLRRAPHGYRAPVGRITAEGIKSLQDRGFSYDSSVLPIFRPDRYGYNHLHYGLTPFIHENTDILELPVGVIPYMRAPMTLSFAKLFGLGFYRRCVDMLGLPTPLVLQFHLHDVFQTRALQRMSGWKKLAHQRNIRNASQILSDLIQIVKNRGYRFILMSQLYETYRRPI